MLRIKLECPNHRRYNPERDGEGGIRGACRYCQELFQLYIVSVNLIRKVTEEL